MIIQCSMNVLKLAKVQLRIKLNQSTISNGESNQQTDTQYRVKEDSKPNNGLGA